MVAFFSFFNVKYWAFLLKSKVGTGDSSSISVLKAINFNVQSWAVGELMDFKDLSSERVCFQNLPVPILTLKPQKTLQCVILSRNFTIHGLPVASG